MEFEEDYRCGKWCTKEQEDWLKEHSAHGEIVQGEVEHQPPTYRLYKLVCGGCGGTLTGLEKEQKDAD